MLRSEYGGFQEPHDLALIKRFEGEFADPHMANTIGTSWRLYGSGMHLLIISMKTDGMNWVVFFL